MADLLHRAKALSFLRPLTTGAVVCGLAILAAAALQSPSARAQAAAPFNATPAAASAPAAKAATSKPLWGGLTAEQQAALKPLAPYWNGISEPHKRKWLALSRNFAAMTPEDQTTLHSRMTEWAGLSAQQRAQARLNFAEVKRLPVDERKAKWEAYQALSEDEKRKLADSARSARPASVAVPTRPVPARKLAPVPAIPASLAKGEHTPRIQLAPSPSAAASVPAVPSPTPVTPLVPSPMAQPAPSPAAAPPVPAEAQVPAPGASAR
jgi:hypothetical protein